KKVKETFFLAVSNDELFKIIDRFSRYDKTVACIYPAAHALSCIVHSSIDDEPLLCVTESGMSKSLFLAVNGKPCFVRSVQSLESGMHDIDVHDINMTVNYCRQTLRLNPSKVILLGSACLKCETTMNFTLPAACIHPPPNIIAPQETVMDFIMPISALLPDEKLKSGNILPQRYRLLTLQKKVVTYCMMLLLVLSFAGLGYMKMKITEILEIKRSVDMLRDEIKQMETNRLSYEAHTRELQQFVPLINVINRANAYPDMQKALIALSALKAPYMSNAHIRSIDISAEATGFKLLLRGDVTATQYADMQRIYQELIGRIKKIKGMEVSSDRLDLKDKSF
ncbi:MAG: hypothetical protein HY099_03550, partial [Nitrospirae bacterium]|nr:hypothetical protein [Nitrospirota bacterium]